MFKKNRNMIRYNDYVVVKDKDDNELFIGRIKVYTPNRIIIERRETMEFDAKVVKMEKVERGK